jgi:hypothetical protein
MDLSMVDNDDYFTTNQSATQTFTYAEILLPNNTRSNQTHKSPQMDDDDQKDVFSDITGTRTSMTEDTFRQEMERLHTMKEKELQETRAIIEAQRKELQTLRENHLQEITAQREKFDEVQKQNMISQEQVEIKLHNIQQQLRLEMARMMEQLMHTNITTTTTPFSSISTTDSMNQAPLMNKRTNEEPEQPDQSDTHTQGQTA